MPSGKKKKRHKMSTHKRKKRLRKNRHTLDTYARYNKLQKVKTFYSHPIIRFDTFGCQERHLLPEVSFLL